MTPPVDQCIRAIIRTAAEIVATLESEIECLRTKKTRDLMPIVNQKVRLTAAFERELRTLATTPDYQLEVLPALAEELRTAKRRLERVIAENARMIEAARTAHDRLLNSIVEAVRSQRGRLAGYGPPTSRVSASRGRGAVAAPIALDRRM